MLVKTVGRVGTLPISMATDLPNTQDNGELLLEVRRCAAALERIAEWFDPTPVRAAFTIGTPTND